DDPGSRHGRREASRAFDAAGHLPGVTGRAFPAPCGASCVLGINQPPVTIKNIEVSIIDRAFEEGWVRPVEPVRQTGRSVAVVGSGPAGPAAAQRPTPAGHSAVVLERDDRLGGLLRYGIPEFKLEKRHLERRLQQMRAEGTRFRTGVDVGGVGPDALSASELRSRFDAVVLATGASVPRELTVPGRGASGIHPAMEYLTQANRFVEGDRIEHPL